MNHAQREFDVLEKHVDNPIIAPYRDKIINLVEEVKKEQSGGSVGFYASAVGSVVRKLILQMPICDIFGDDLEWNDVSEEMGGKITFQNNRLSAIFKNGDGRAYYLDAIVFRPLRNPEATFTGNSVGLKDGTKIYSKNYIKRFPFKPKTFYIDVHDKEYSKDPETGKLTEKEGGGWWESWVADESQLEEVWEYYDRFQSQENTKHN